MKIDHEGVCKGCEEGKNTKNLYPKSKTKLEGILELIHSDVCGPMPSTSLSGYVCYVYMTSLAHVNYGIEDLLI